MHPNLPFCILDTLIHDKVLHNYHNADTLLLAFSPFVIMVHDIDYVSIRYQKPIFHSIIAF